MKQYRYYGDVEVGFLEDIDSICREKGVETNIVIEKKVNLSIVNEKTELRAAKKIWKMNKTNCDFYILCINDKLIHKFNCEEWAYNGKFKNK